jgi:hypothetical protein
MSTGDQTEYVRGKMAERGVGQQAKFMKDGFDRWAESSEPAREGQVEKIPAEVQMEGRGGALSLKSARQLYSGMQVGKKAVKYAKSKLAGGAITVEQVKNGVKSLLDVYRKISTFIDDFKQDVTDEIIDNPAFASKTNVLKFSKKLVSFLDSLKVYKDTFDAIAKAAESYGLGRQPRGGALMDDIKTYGTKIMEMYTFLKEGAPALRTILGFKSLQPMGNKILNLIEPALKAIGAGRGGQRCQCDDKHGGAQVSFTGGEMAQTSRIDGSDGDYYEDDPQSQMMGIFGHKMGRAPAQKSMAYVTDQIISQGKRAAGRRVIGGAVKRPSNMFEDVDRRIAMYGDELRRMDNETMFSGKRSSEYSSIRAKYDAAMRDRENLMGEGRHGGAACGGASLAEMGRAASERMRNASVSGMVTAAAKRARDAMSVSRGGRKPSARGAIVKKVMAEKGLSLPQASKYVKENGLY